MTEGKKYVIGRAEKFWTLWAIWSEKRYTTHGSYWHIANIYLRNLSYDLDAAKDKAREIAGEKGFTVDETLRGSTSWEFEEIEPDRFHFGKYKYMAFNECSDTGYLCWFWKANRARSSETNVERNKLIVEELESRKDAHFYEFYDGTTSWVTTEAKEKAEKARRDYNERLAEREALKAAKEKRSGYHGKDGERVTMDLYLMPEYRVIESEWGASVILNFVDEKGKGFEYFGSSSFAHKMIYERKEDEKVMVSITATLSHVYNDYNGLKTTRLKRPRLNSVKEKV